MGALLNWFIGVISDAVSAIISVLPNDPFSFDWSAVNPYLSTLNYFIPIPGIIDILGAYVAAVLIWYVYRWVLRIVRLIGG